VLAFYQKADLKQLRERAQQLEQDVIQTFGSLDGTLISAKPAPREWSAAECFEHLNLTMRLYFPILPAVQQGSYKAGLLERIPGLPSFFAWVIMWALDPSYKGMAMNSPSSIRPTQSLQGKESIDAFIQTQREYLALMEQTNQPAQLKTIIQSPLVPVATYSVIDSFRITIMHNEHHIGQAKRAIAQAQQALSQV
jgi:hypothetical protein